MHVRFSSLVALVAAALWLAPTQVATQAQNVAADPAVSARGWVPPKTPDGQPDIQGIWANYDPTPFETPSAADRRRNDPTGPSGDFADSAPSRNARRQSMVVEPPTGRVPVLAWAEAKRDSDMERIQDHWEFHTPWERCITRGIPGGLFPSGYGNGYRIVQSPGIVAIFYEMIHEPRIIRVDGSPHLPSHMRFWNGDSRGRWEGNTLVVDITNYNGKGVIATNVATGRIKGIPASADLHVVERFTLINPTTISYEVTITDPKVYSAPWKVQIPITKDDSYEMYEYACHEGNYAMPNTLSAGRAGDRTSQSTTNQK
jgi:hypothetical protein